MPVTGSRPGSPRSAEAPAYQFPTDAASTLTIDSLYKVSVALKVPLRYLADVQPGRQRGVPSEQAEKIFALVAGSRRRQDLRRAYATLRALLGADPVPSERRP